MAASDLPSEASLKAWADLYQNDEIKNEKSIRYEDPHLDPLLMQIREMERVCSEMDRLRCAIQFASTELTELLNLRSIAQVEANLASRTKRAAHEQHLQHTQAQIRDFQNQERLSPYIYRVAVRADAVELSAFAKKVLREEYTKPPYGYTEEGLVQHLSSCYEPYHWVDHIENEDRYLLLALTRNTVDPASGSYIAARIVGYCMVGGLSTRPETTRLSESESVLSGSGSASVSEAKAKARREPCAGEIYQCYVCPTLLGKGVAKVLTGKSLAWLLLRFPGDVCLRMHCENGRAHGFYKKMGFSLSSEYSADIHNVGREFRMFVYRLDRNHVSNHGEAQAEQWSKGQQAAAAAEAEAATVSEEAEISLLEAERSLRLFEEQSLRPLLQDLVALKNGIFCEDYRSLEANMDMAMAVAVDKTRHRNSVIPFGSSGAGAGAGAGAIAGTGTVYMASYEVPHHALFMEHLGMFTWSLLLRARVAERRQQWLDASVIYKKIIHFMTYSGRYCDHSGISVSDIERRARERRAVNAVSARSSCTTSSSSSPSPSPSPSSVVFYHERPISVVGNLDICRMRVRCALALFSCTKFEESSLFATQAVQGLALAPTHTASPAGGTAMFRSNNFLRSHARVNAPTIHETLTSAACATAAGSGGSGVGGGGVGSRGERLVQTYGEAYETALALSRYFSAAAKGGRMAA